MIEVVYTLRFHGSDDIELGIRLPQHLLEEGDEGKVCERNELLRLSLNAITLDPHALCICG